MKTTRREGTATRGTRVQGQVTSSCWAGEGVGTGGRKPEDLLEASPCCQRDRSLTDRRSLSLRSTRGQSRGLARELGRPSAPRAHHRRLTAPPPR